MTIDNLVPGVEVVGPGVGVILDGQLWTVERLTGTDVVLSRPGTDEVRSLSRSEGWSRFTSADGAGAVLLDDEGVRQWKKWGPADRLRWFFRVCVVNMVLTGYRLGHEALAGDGEPLLDPIRPGEEIPSIAERAQSVFDVLTHRRDLDWVIDLLWASRGERAAELRPRPLADHIPKPRTIQTWVSAVQHQGVWALRDGRRGRSGGKRSDRERRQATETLAEEVVKDNRKLSTLAPAEQHRQLSELAAKRGVAILGRTQSLEILKHTLRRHGSTPAQKQSVDYNKTRGTRRNIRPLYPGSNLALDATWGDNRCVLVPGGKPFRPWIIALWDVATGIILAIWATGRYRQIDVQMAFHDACRPLHVAPPHLLVPPRIKGHPRSIEVMSDEAWAPVADLVKPGAVPRTVRADNAKQHSGADVMLMLNTLGIDLSSSRKGRSTDNPNAESGFASLRPFFQRMPQYTGSTPSDRGRSDEAPALLSFYNAKLQEWAYTEHNLQPSPAPVGGLADGAGLTRLEHWDVMVEVTGAMPVLLDPTAYFIFKPQRLCTRTQKGIRLNRQVYSDPILFELGPNVVDRGDHLVVHHDPRDQSCVWIHDPDEGKYYEIPNVLREHTNQPLTEHIVKAALDKINLRNAHNRAHHPRIADQIERVDMDSMDVRRDLADLANARFTVAEAVRDGARIIPSRLAEAPAAPARTFDPWAPLPRMDARA